MMEVSKAIRVNHQGKGFVLSTSTAETLSEKLTQANESITFIEDVPRTKRFRKDITPIQEIKLSSTSTEANDLVSKGLDKVNKCEPISNLKKTDMQKTLAKLTQSNMTQIEKNWALESEGMDPNERDEINDEIHCIPSCRILKENPNIITRWSISLRNLIQHNVNQELNNGKSLAPITKQAYKIAAFELKNTYYILSQPFLLRFLRAELFDVEKAALRFFRYLDLLLVFFGKGALTKPLQLSDLSRNDIRCLRKGACQLYPGRDRAGRRILSYIENGSTNYRVLLYMMDVCSRDETTQKRGLVRLHPPGRMPMRSTSSQASENLVTHPEDEAEYIQNDPMDLKIHHKLDEGCPLRVSAIHYCFPDAPNYRARKAYTLICMTSDERKKVRFHTGNQIKCSEILQSYGISSWNTPMTTSGTIKTKVIKNFLVARSAIEKYYSTTQMQFWCGEETTMNGPGGECPGLNCVLLGGKSFYHYPANVMFRELMMYSNSVRETNILNEMPVSSFQCYIQSLIRTAMSSEYKMRFLKRDKESLLWTEYDNNSHELYTKISQMLRDERKRCGRSERGGRQQKRKTCD